MIDMKLIEEQSELVAANNKKRGAEIDLAIAQGLIKERARLIAEVDEVRMKGNDVADQMKKAPDNERDALIAKGKELKEKGKALEASLADVIERLNDELAQYPNLLRDDVPEGADEKANQELKKVGKPTNFSFETKDHLEIGEALGVIDMERAAKVSGARFAYLKGDLVMLELALVNYALSVLLSEGFVPVLPPHIVSSEAMRGMGYLDQGGDAEVYHLRDDDAVLIGTSEQAIGPMLKDEMLDGGAFPLRFVGISPCYRREAGSYGKDTRGLIRMHQFDKIEMFSFTHPEESDKEHEFLLSVQEKLMEGLKLPYRVMKLSSGDTGYPSARTYDIETWMPSQETYRETHSTSNTTDFQTRRLNIRYKKDGEKGFAHALNGTAFALGRIMVAILENYQNEDGSVTVPDALRPWFGKDQIG